MNQLQFSPWPSKTLPATILLAVSFLPLGCKKSAEPSATQSPAPAATSTPSQPAEAGQAQTPAPASPSTQAASSTTAGATNPSAGSGTPVAPMAAPAETTQGTPPQASPPPEPIVVPAGTAVTVRLDDSLSSKTSTTGQTFSGEVGRAVSVHGHTAIPVGSRVTGVVTEVKSAGKFKGAADLGLTLKTISIRGNSYPVSTSAFSEQTTGKGKRTTKMVAGGTGGGALIGGIAGGGKGAAIGAAVGAGVGTAGAATTGNNRDITLAPEATVSFKLKAPITLPPPPPPSNAK